MSSAFDRVDESPMRFGNHLHTKPLHATQLVADYTTMIRGCKEARRRKESVNLAISADWQAIVRLT